MFETLDVRHITRRPAKSRLTLSEQYRALKMMVKFTTRGGYKARRGIVNFFVLNQASIYDFGLVIPDTVHREFIMNYVGRVKEPIVIYPYSRKGQVACFSMYDTRVSERDMWRLEEDGMTMPTGGDICNMLARHGLNYDDYGDRRENKRD